MLSNKHFWAGMRADGEGNLAIKKHHPFRLSKADGVFKGNYLFLQILFFGDYGGETIDPRGFPESRVIAPDLPG